MAKKVLIIGAGMGGLAAGIYARKCGFEAEILEAHSISGGQCTSWKRKGYVFDACIHHLFGCSPATGINRLWRELGAMPLPMVPTRECFAVQLPDGRTFRDYWNLDELEEHMLGLVPGDAKAVRSYIRALKALRGADLFGGLATGSPGKVAKAVALLALHPKLVSSSAGAFASRFKDPAMRRALENCVYSIPEMPFFMHMTRHAYGLAGDVRWPAGGARSLAAAMEATYRELGGRVEFRARVARILVEGGKAVGARLEDGSERRGDFVVSDADGRKTIMDLLGGEFADEAVRRSCAEPDDRVNWAVHVFLGVDMDLSNEPSDLVILLDREVELAGERVTSIELQTFGHDASMAPPGKGVIKVELFSRWSHWAPLESDRAAYGAEKAKTVDAVLGVLERRWPDIRKKVEAVDVPTLSTWERFMGGTRGFNNMPKKDFKLSMLIKKPEMGLPGLSNFYFAGVWATSTPALFMNALSGKKVIQRICAQERVKFKSE